METVAISKIEVLPQVRTVMDENSLNELAVSIKEHGVLEPLGLAPKKGEDGHFLLKFGARRLEASKIAGLTKVPYVIVKLDEEDTILVQLIENIQREDLNDMDQADAFQKLIDKHGYTVDRLVEKTGKTKGYVKQRLTLLKAAPEVQEAVRRMEIEFSAARALCGLSVDEQATALATAIEEEVAAQKAIDERKAKILELPGYPRAEEEEIPDEGGEEEDDDDEEEEEDDAETAAEGTTKPKKAKKTKVKKDRKPREKKKGLKAKTSTIKRNVRRKKTEGDGKQVTISDATMEKLTEKSAEWVKAFVDEDTNGVGLEDGLSSVVVKNLMKRFCKYLLEQKVLIIR